MKGKQPRLRDQVRAVIRVNHYSIRTEKTYWYWIRYFIRFQQMKHPRDMGPREVNEFLTWVAVHRYAAAAMWICAPPRFTPTSSAKVSQGCAVRSATGQ
jgi:hypothetical protein